jgi:hypothetical protein
MNFLKPSLNSILEENTDFCIELTYYSDSMPAIKSYYFMNSDEYENLKTLYLDIYIENFINGETLIKDKLDIYLINNKSNIDKCKTFIEQFGNTFDILSLINAKKQKKETKKIIINDILTTDFSDTDNSICNSDSETDSDSLEYTEQFIKFKNKNNSDDKCINTLTEIIDTFNKTDKLDNSKLSIIAENKPELLDDEILSEIIKIKLHE